MIVGEKRKTVFSFHQHSFYHSRLFTFCLTFIPLYIPSPERFLVTHRPSSSERFSMQRYSVYPVVKYRFANGSRILRQPSANRRLAFSPRLVIGQSRTSRVLLLHSAVGYSVSSCTLFTCLIRPFPAVSLA